MPSWALHFVSRSFSGLLRQGPILPSVAAACDSLTAGVAEPIPPCGPASDVLLKPVELEPEPAGKANLPSDAQPGVTAAGSNNNAESVKSLKKDVLRA
jgi:hypothetical protein